MIGSEGFAGKLRQASTLRGAICPDAGGAPEELSGIAATARYFFAVSASPS